MIFADELIEKRVPAGRDVRWITFENKTRLEISTQFADQMRTMREELDELNCQIESHRNAIAELKTKLGNDRTEDEVSRVSEAWKVTYIDVPCHQKQIEQILSKVEAKRSEMELAQTKHDKRMSRFLTAARKLPNGTQEFVVLKDDQRGESINIEDRQQFIGSFKATTPSPYNSFAFKSLEVPAPTLQDEIPPALPHLSTSVSQPDMLGEIPLTPPPVIKRCESEPIPADWHEDKEHHRCEICVIKFTILHRRHHCRGCGQVVCSRCSPFKMNLPMMKGKEVRVCIHCYDKHGPVGTRYSKDEDDMM
eukprot:TRINITY_DN331_c0_g1_i1.p1 TRINITY_DN331_c0_g1~~TRINITY_DN331_c0_g1_i1.p1  ORF type:complete len:307 (-),score=61.78 TRINITY_DN331_c0_g1_i1:41-961(-)